MRLLAQIRALLSSTERRRAFGLLGLMLVGSGLETLSIGVILPAIALLTQPDIAQRHPSLQAVMTALGNPTQVQLVAGGMLALVGIYLVKTLVLAFLAWRQTTFAFDVQVDLCQRLFSTYMRQPYTFHLQRNSAQLIRNLVTGVWQFTGLVVNGMGLLTEGLVLVGIATLLLLVDPVGALIVVVAIGLAAWAFQRMTRSRVMRWGIARQHHEGLRIQHLQQGLGSAKDVKLLGREDDFLARYGVHNVQSGQAARYQTALLMFPRLFLELLAVSGLATLVLVQLAQGRDLAGIVPTVGLFAVAAIRLTPSATKIIAAIQALRYDMPVIGILYDDLSLPVPESLPKNVIPLTFESEIQVANVSFLYPGAPAPTLNDLSITIRKGESVGIIGPSGAGKSTLVDIILGLLTPSAGRVMVDGQDIQQNLRGWQTRVGYVPQSIYLTDDTLRCNVAFGLAAEQIDDDAVQRAVKAAQLEEFVASLPAGLETMVGERGVRLSGGQRQRIGIARALYHDPAVLVLDEATSALDTETERGVVEAVTALQRNKTIVVVAHRLSTVQHCDRLYQLSGADGNGSAEVSLDHALLAQPDLPPIETLSLNND